MVLAQSMSEYGALSGALAGAVAALSRTLGTVADALRHPEPMTWAAIGAAAFLLLLLLRR